MTRLLQLVLRFGRRDIAKDTMMGLTYEASLLVSTVLSFSLLGRSLGTEGFGDYASLYAIAAPLITLATTGVALAQSQHVIRDREDLERTTQSCFSLGLIGGLLMTVVGTAAALLIVSGVGIHTILPIMLLEFVTYPAVLIAANTVQVRDGYAASTPVRLVPICLRMLILVVLFATDSLTIATLGLSFLVVTAVLGVVQIHRVSRRFGIKVRPGRIQVQHLKTSLVYSSGVSGFAVQNDGDKMVLQAYNYKTDVGLYSAAYKIVQFGLIPVNAFMAVTHNRFLVHDDDAKGQHITRALRFGAVCVVYGVVFGLLVVAAAPLITIIVGDEFKDSVTIVRWLAPLVLLRALSIFPLNGLMGLGHARLRTILLLASAALSLVLYIALIPLWQWKGAAIGTLIGDFFLAVTAWFFLVYLQRRHDQSVAARTAGEPRPSLPSAAPTGAH